MLEEINRFTEQTLCCRLSSVISWTLTCIICETPDTCSPKCSSVALPRLPCADLSAMPSVAIVHTSHTLDITHKSHTELKTDCSSDIFNSIN